jgi:hypothetical protein
MPLKSWIKKKLNQFWYNLLCRVSAYGIIEKTRHHRNDDEITLKARLDDPIFLERFGFKVFSQNDEDGIIEEIFNRIKTTNRTFVEFGVQNGLESNCHYLLHKGWNGLWIEGDGRAVKEIKRLFQKPVNDKRLTVLKAFINRDNINILIEKEGGISGEIDLLSIDIDGNDYWVWEAINIVNPRVVAIEYNAKFPPNFEWVMEYEPMHIWRGDDKHSASLKSLELLGTRLGYRLVGTNISGMNAFFVRKDAAKDLFADDATAINLYNPTRWTMKYISGHPSRTYIGKTGSTFL